MIGPIVGSFCLGIVMGWIIRYFLARIGRLNMKIFSAIVSVIGGGAVIKMFPDPFQYAGWFYPIGLLIGILLYPALSRLESGKNSSDRALGRSLGEAERGTIEGEKRK